MHEGAGRAVAAGGAGKRSDLVDCSIVDLNTHVLSSKGGGRKCRSTKKYNFFLILWSLSRARREPYYTLAGQSDLSMDLSIEGMLHTLSGAGSNLK